MNAKFFHGFSLVELMVALLISSILLGGVLTVMSSSKKTYTLQSEYSALQDNARFLIDELTYKIRMAGYKGCLANPLRDNPFASNTQDNTTSEPPSDQLTIVSFGEILPLAPLEPGETFLGATTINLASGIILPPSLAVGSRIKISACGMDKPQEYGVASIQSSSGNVSLGLDRPLDRFSGGMEVFNGLQEIIYRVQTDSSSGLVGLYKCQDNNPDGQCNNEDQFNIPFVDGVQSMQVRYGINKPGGIQFEPTTREQNDEIIAVRISLLMRTPQKRGIPSTTNKSFYLDPLVTYNPYDRLENEEGFRHRLFTTTIQVRNSIIN